MENFTVFSDHLIPSSSSVNCSNKALESWQSQRVCMGLEEQRHWLLSSISEIRMRLTTCHFGTHCGGPQIIFSINSQSLLGKTMLQPNSPSPAHPLERDAGREGRHCAALKMELLWAAGQRTDTASWQQICQRNHEAGMRGFQLIQEIIFRASLRAKHNTKLASERAGAMGGWQRSGAGARGQTWPRFLSGTALGLSRTQLPLGCVSLLCGQASVYLQWSAWSVSGMGHFSELTSCLHSALAEGSCASLWLHQDFRFESHHFYQHQGPPPV